MTDYRKIEGKNYVQQVEEKYILSIYIHIYILSTHEGFTKIDCSVLNGEKLKAVP